MSLFPPNSFLNQGYCFGQSKHVFKYLYDFKTRLGNLQELGNSHAISWGLNCFSHSHGSKSVKSVTGVGFFIQSIT
ncbi:hypothetical protein G9C98_005818 [Cotesia typhae]|uniref:Uncharacterized protein n=1 Tax=Cotesia typhae TaxID=2053667 RepID=A0A8J5URD5_9HYME|nr:hypothetical protein G9C98_005818 [Cotesia typhae]